MNFFRNPEVFKDLLFHLALSAALTAAGFFCSPSLVPPLLMVCLLFTFLHFGITLRRYWRIRALSMELDTLLHEEAPVHFEDYVEGELSILKSEIGKMTLRLREQSDALNQDKLYLADSIADISHQIRTPLTSIHIVLSLLSSPDLTDERRSGLLQQLNRLCSRIEWLIEALLKISRLDAGTVAFQKEPVLVTALIRKAASSLEVAMELREQRLLVACETGTESFLGDFFWSAEAVSNLLKNCMEHSPQGGTIRVSASENALFTEILVEDDGPGFAKEDLPHLFERFYKGKNSGEQSIGIGLALTRMILSCQNGTVKAENKPDQGARFTLRFYKGQTC